MVKTSRRKSSSRRRVRRKLLVNWSHEFDFTPVAFYKEKRKLTTGSEDQYALAITISPAEGTHDRSIATGYGLLLTVVDFVPTRACFMYVPCTC